MSYEIPAYQIPPYDIAYGQMGMTLRDHFASVALGGDMASHEEGWLAGDFDLLVERAYRVADAMMKERDKDGAR